MKTEQEIREAVSLIEKALKEMDLSSQVKDVFVYALAALEWVLEKPSEIDPMGITLNTLASHFRGKDNLP